MRKIILLALFVSLSVPLAAQTWEAGASGDDRHRYAYVNRYHPIPLSPGREIRLWVGGSYLDYDLSNGESVSSPGASVGAMYRQSSRDFGWGLGAGWEARWTRREVEGTEQRETETGPVVRGEVNARLAPKLIALGGGSWSGANEWVGSRGMLLYELSPTLRVGPEGGFHGNDDLRLREVGGVVGIALDRSWIYLRGGQAASRERGGIERTEPYFSVGIGTAF